MPGGRIVPVFNRAPRPGRGRAALATALADLVAGRSAAAAALPSPIFLPDRAVDAAIRDGARLHTALTAPLAAAFDAVLERSGARATAVDEPELVAPGTLGAWHDA